MEDNDVLTIDCAPSSRNGIATLTVKLNDDLLAVESLNLTKPKARADFLKKTFYGRPDIDPNAVSQKLLQFAAEVAKPKSNARPEGDKVPDPKALLAAMPKSVRGEARTMLMDPDLLKRVNEDISTMGVAGERTLEVTLYLLGTSRLLEKPLAAIVQGPSCSGKSYIIDKVGSLFPPESVIYATRMTPQALFHMPPGSLSNRFIVAGERSKLENDEAAEATRALREMLSSGHLVKLIPLRLNGEMQTVAIKQDGPIAYVESTTLTKIMPEDANRTILLTTDERSKQTRKILAQSAAIYGGAAAEGQLEQVILRHHAAQRMLKSYCVVIPFAEKLGSLINDNRVEIRRAFPQIMSLIQASALLHQKQRPVDDEGRLLADSKDYQIARRLLAKPMARLLGGQIADPAKRFHMRLIDWFALERVFSTRDATQKESGSKSSVTGWLRELHEAGLIESVVRGCGAKPATWRTLSVGTAEASAATLPTMEELFRA